MVAELMHFFDSESDYDTGDFSIGIVRENHLYRYVSSTLLEGFINYVDIIGAVLLERYDHIYPEDIKEAKKDFHTKIHKFENDVLILARSPYDKEIVWFFWFDCDVSDCQIGRFTTKSTDERLMSMLKDYAESLIQGKPEEREEDWDFITGWVELSKTDFSGWISW